MKAFSFPDFDAVDSMSSRRKRRKFQKSLLGHYYIVGPVAGADGTTPATGRQTKTGDAGISQCHGKYYEPASRGVLFFGTCAVAGIAVTNAQAIGNTSMYSLYNPAASGKRLSVKRVRVGYVSGTLAAGALYHCVNTVAVAAPTGTAIVARTLDAGNQSAVAAVGVALSVATVVGANTVAIGPIVSFGAQLATTANPLALSNEDVDGEIVIEPGYGYQIQAIVAGAGTSPLLTLGVTWEEIPIVASAG